MHTDTTTTPDTTPASDAALILVSQSSSAAHSLCATDGGVVYSASLEDRLIRNHLNNHCKKSDFLLNLSSGMQTVIQVIATGTGSLRNKIMSDPQLEKKFGFIKIWHKQPGRPHGWAKIHSGRDVHGAINLEWHARSRTLICRVVTKLGNKPNSIIGDFVDYLLARHQSRILAIHIMRR